MALSTNNHRRLVVAGFLVFAFAASCSTDTQAQGASLEGAMSEARPSSQIDLRVDEQRPARSTQAPMGEPGIATYSWTSHVEVLGRPHFGAPTGGVGVQDDYRADYRRIEGILGFDESCVRLSGRFAFVNPVWDEQAVSFDPAHRAITYLGQPETPLAEPKLFAQGDWIVADVLRIADASRNDLGQNDAVASSDFVSRMPNDRCTSPHWVVIVDVLEHLPQEVWNPAADG